MIQPDKIIKKVHLTEKSNILSSEIGQYTFEVSKSSTKDTIKAAVEKAFDVTVNRVNVVNQIGKPRRNRKTGKASSAGAGFKKAIVTLKQGDAIDFTA